MGNIGGKIDGKISRRKKAGKIRKKSVGWGEIPKFPAFLLG